MNDFIFSESTCLRLLAMAFGPMGVPGNWRASKCGKEKQRKAHSAGYAFPGQLFFFFGGVKVT